ncbi:MAG TPA: biotin/lipoyl-binding protein [Prolixibacteraceae bacterium]|jgi:biotin carboxyl carrier protein|nr:biotin/lipoyl-binding protein [Prolixibacteraceae bacterium]HOY52176.1 biotin/lipoyl-binding protein [Prolixibacteraceae bacterium]HPJ77985.1 biotin/lipoyl-binding protein [Prolixibacteraceae bacterium]HRV88090.1 biotin/lipoyl-binding protein [Prolixibacteraceae bacterium]
MSVEIRIKNRLARVELLERNDNLLKIKVDEMIYHVDLMHTTGGTFSILEGGRSWNIELIPKQEPRKYTAYTYYETYDVEVIDAEARYLLNRGGGGPATGEKSIRSPMPGKVVKILVREGDAVTHGQTAIILSAMKMESEYKAPFDGKVRKVHVGEGDIVEGNQPLIEFEA